MIVEDGEGATKFIEIEVKNAKTKKQAKRIALSIANSDLFKTMCYGNDPNFGRVASAAGASGEDIKPNLVDIYLNKKLVVQAGVAKNIKLPKNLMKCKNINVVINLNKGSAKAVIFTSDLSVEYIKINAKYN